MDDFQEGRLFFIKDSFFNYVNDCYLKKNKEDTQRPHFYALQDQDTGLYWAIPCSSKIEKYKKIIADKQANNKRHNHIQIIKVAGKEQVFLYQDMFPIKKEYIKEVYKNKYGYMEIRDPKKLNGIQENALKIIKLLRHGIKFTPTQPDILKIESILLAETQDEVAATKENELKVAGLQTSYFN